MSKKQTAKREKNYTQSQIINEFGLPKSFIRKHFPPPKMMKRSKQGNMFPLWTEKQVQKALNSPAADKYMRQREAEAAEQRREQEIRGILESYSPSYYIAQAQKLSRYFILHIGPTNSGKTYDAVEDLKKNTPGTYLGPLRLLALEMSDKINAAGIPCSMITGEEAILKDNAQIISSTIELCDFTRHFRTAVIDEAQLIGDPDRGAAWMKALCMVDADVVHVCLAPEAANYIVDLITSFGSEYVIENHKRLAPLTYAGTCHGIRDIRPGDALICFSRKSVLSTAAQLEKKGFRTSVIYGALPPQARRDEVRKYMAGESNVVVATDAIGLGISLPIARIIFTETSKFDGKQTRQLNVAEVKQIAGRAGRYGLNEYGEVLNFGEHSFVGGYLNAQSRTVKGCCIAFPREVLQTDYPLEKLLRLWQNLKHSKLFIREDMQDALILLASIKKLVRKNNRELVFDLITCPVDTSSMELVGYWTQCASAIIKGKEVPEPYFGTGSLQACELQYRAWDIHHQLLRRVGREEDCSNERDEICRQIAMYMAQNKDQYIRRCRRCGKVLEIGYPFGLCEHCYEVGRYII
jgi:ATP-dependent RNA helicase SUPV3L1/SUV3